MRSDISRTSLQIARLVVVGEAQSVVSSHKISRLLPAYDDYKTRLDFYIPGVNLVLATVSEEKRHFLN